MAKIKRTPKLFLDDKGKKYIKLNGKKIYIKSKLKDKELTGIVIKNIIQTTKRRPQRKQPAPPRQPMTTPRIETIKASIDFNKDLMDMMSNILKKSTIKTSQMITPTKITTISTPTQTITPSRTTPTQTITQEREPEKIPEKEAQKYKEPTMISKAVKQIKGMFDTPKTKDLSKYINEVSVDKPTLRVPLKEAPKPISESEQKKIKEDIKFFDDDLKTKQDQIKRLEEVLRIQDDKFNKNDKQIKEQEKQIENLKKDIEKAKKEVDDETNKNVNILDEKQDERLKIIKSINDLQEQEKKYLDNIVDLKIKIDELKQDLEFKKYLGEVGEKDIKTNEKLIDSLKGNIKDYEIFVNEAKKEAEKFKEQKKELEQEIENQKSIIYETNKELGKLLNEKQNKENETMKIKQDSEDIITQQKQKIKEIDQYREDAENIADQLKKSLEVLGGDVKAKQNELETLKAQIESLKTEKAQVETLLSEQAKETMQERQAREKEEEIRMKAEKALKEKKLKEDADIIYRDLSKKKSLGRVDGVFTSLKQKYDYIQGDDLKTFLINLGGTEPDIFNSLKKIGVDDFKKLVKIESKEEIQERSPIEEEKEIPIETKPEPIISKKLFKTLTKFYDDIPSMNEDVFFKALEKRNPKEFKNITEKIMNEDENKIIQDYKTLIQEREEEGEQMLEEYYKNLPTEEYISPEEQITYIPEDEPREPSLYESQSESELGFGKIAEITPKIKGLGLDDLQAKGLYNYEIDEIMNKYKDDGFLGTIPRDGLSKIYKKVKAGKPFSFVMNTLGMNDKRVGHWVCCNLDANGYSFEYYDPLGDNPDKNFQNDITPILEKWDSPVYLKYKINKVKKQSDRTNTCGWHCMDFLIKRYSGLPFPEATDFDIKKGEGDVKELKKKYNKFGFI